MHAAQVDLGGVVAVLSRHLYSTPDVVVRELVQNAKDSITRRRLGDSAAPSGHIHVATGSHTLAFTDNGAGLTAEEVHRHLATVGAGGTRELRAASGSDELIGLFGLGFLTAFVVAERVTVTTTAVSTPFETWRYVSTEPTAYTLEPAPRRPVGTVVELHLRSDANHLAQTAVVRQLLVRYCGLLDATITLDDDSSSLTMVPPWRAPGDVEEAERLRYASTQDERFTPIVTLPVNEAAWGRPDADLAGLLWVHDGSTYGSTDNRHLAVYVRGMLLDPDARELVPRWAGFVSGAIESTSLTPTASRERLQEDADHLVAKLAVEAALVDGLVEVARSHPAAWRRVLRRHNELLLGAALCDDRLFRLLAADLTVPTSRGDLTVAGLRHGQRLHVALTSDGGFEDMLFRALGVAVARGDRYGVLAFLRRYAAGHGLEMVEVGSDKAADQLFSPAMLDPDDHRWIAAELGGDHELVAARFSPPLLPFVVIRDADAELKARIEADDLDAVAGRASLALARLHTSATPGGATTRLVVNVACPTVALLLAARREHPAAATRAVTILRLVRVLMEAGDRGRGGEADVLGALTDAAAVLDGLLLEGAP